jgi:tRNA A58 N-methylase Trm61
MEPESARSVPVNISTSTQDTEADVCQFLQSVVQKGWTCVDVGANVGSITAVLAECVGPTGRVLAFEAHPENARALRENMKSKRYAARVRVGNLAITNGKRSRIPL